MDAIGGLTSSPYVSPQEDVRPAAPPPTPAVAAPVAAPTPLEALGGDPAAVRSDGEGAVRVVGEQAAAAGQVVGASAEASRFLTGPGAGPSTPPPSSGAAAPMEGVQRYLARPSDDELTAAYDDVTARMSGSWRTPEAARGTAAAIDQRLASMPPGARGEVLGDAARQVAEFAGGAATPEGVRTVGAMAPVLGTADPDQAQASQRVVGSLAGRLRESEGNREMRDASVDALGEIARGGDARLGQQAARTLLAGPASALEAGLRGEIAGTPPAQWAEMARQSNDPALSNRLLEVARGLGPEHVQRLEEAGIRQQEIPRHPVDSVLAGVGDGIRGVADTVEAVVTRPVETATGIVAGVGQAIAHPIDTGTAIAQGVQRAWEEDPYRVAGRAVFEVGLTLAGGAGAARQAARAGEVVDATRAGAVAREGASVAREAEAAAARRGAADAVPHGEVQAPRPVEPGTPRSDLRPGGTPAGEAPRPVETPAEAPRPAGTPAGEAPRPVETPAGEAPRPVETPTGEAPRPSEVRPSEATPAVRPYEGPGVDEIRERHRDIRRVYDDDEGFDRMMAAAEASGGEATRNMDLAYTTISNDALEAVMQNGLVAGRALGRQGPNADAIWFGHGAPFYGEGVTLVIPRERLEALGGRASAGLNGQRNVMTLPYDALPQGIPFSEFAVVESVGRGFVEPIHVPSWWRGPVGPRLPE